MNWIINFSMKKYFWKYTISLEKTDSLVKYIWNITQPTVDSLILLKSRLFNYMFLIETQKRHNGRLQYF